MNFARHLLRRAATAHPAPPSLGVSTLLPSLSAAAAPARAPAAPIPRRPAAIPRHQQSVRHESTTAALGALGGAKAAAEGKAQGQQQEEAKEPKPSYDLTFTCRPCAHRSTHTITKQGYHHGSVLITCPGCHNRHVISDHLMIFGETARSFEDILSQSGSGEAITRRTALSGEEQLAAAERFLKEKGVWSKDGGDVEVLPEAPGEIEEDWRKGVVEENAEEKKE